MDKQESVPRRIAILGSSGSIGQQALEVIAAHPKELKAELLSVNENADLLIEQAKKYKPGFAVINDESKCQYVKDHLANYKEIKVCVSKKDNFFDDVELGRIDIVLTAIVGFAGLKPTIDAIEAGKTIALANKETLVVAGDLITKLAKERGVSILPVDSEHSAIFQCLQGEDSRSVKKLILTASGGPFRGMNLEALKKVTVQDVLKHPIWKMGDKITVDSASLMNKGLEVIEAKWLFDLKPDQIEVLVHPQSIVHSMVQFQDGSIMAQMGKPSMKLPIQYALTYPNRLSDVSIPSFNFLTEQDLSFEDVDRKTFRNFTLADEALKKGGNVPCVLNAANEMAVSAFLKKEIAFSQIPMIIEYCMKKEIKIDATSSSTYQGYLDTDTKTRKFAQEEITSLSSMSPKKPIAAFMS